MNAEEILDLSRNAVMISLYLCAPVLIAGVVFGVLIGLLQTITQVQDQTVAFVPKLVAMVAVLILTAPWLLQRLAEYATLVFSKPPGGL